MFDINFRVQELFQDEKRVPRNTNFAITDSWYVHKKAILVKKNLKFVSVQLLFVYNFRYRYMPPTKGCYSSYYIKKPNVVNTYLIRRENMSQQFRFVYISTMHCNGPENLKKSSPKKLVKSNKSISRKIVFDQFPFFALSKMAKNQFLN